MSGISFMGRIMFLAAFSATATALRADTVTDWSSDWFSWEGHQYRITKATDWDGAQAIATSVGGHLVTIDNAAENDWITRTLIPLAPEGYSPPNKGLWIGFIQDPAASEPSGGWNWVDGQTVTYVNWAPGEPNDQGGAYGDENRGSINELGGWNDFPNNISAGLGGVVEISSPAVVPTPGAAAGGLALLAGLGVRRLKKWRICRRLISRTKE